ncbi:hypothetical protein chiPu_0024915 [Chiloscyllium punctatum]|uniref:Uncharacterized protein n=1 Tax=Chiloscyllium punctatum TaxID=137246 RepID=A0A401TE31_CHIPU|nr:hypothetical protein [Chiloscyllium punctatum]
MPGRHSVSFRHHLMGAGRGGRMERSCALTVEGRSRDHMVVLGRVRSCDVCGSSRRKGRGHSDRWCLNARKRRGQSDGRYPEEAGSEWRRVSRQTGRGGVRVTVGAVCPDNGGGGGGTVRTEARPRVPAARGIRPRPRDPPQSPVGPQTAPIPGGPGVRRSTGEWGGACDGGGLNG